MGTQDLKLAYANWLTAAGATASWEQAQTFLSTQVPWRDLPVQAVQGILNYPDMKVRDGKDVSNTLISHITGFQNLLAQHGIGYHHPLRRGLHGPVQDGRHAHRRVHSPGPFPVAAAILGKLSTEVRTVYLAQRASEATAHFKSHAGAYLPENTNQLARGGTCRWC